MDFKQFYKHLIFDIDENINTLYTAKQGDTKSRGFYVTITQNRVEVPVTTQTLTFYAEKSDGTRVYQNAIKDIDKFRIDLTNQVFAVPGIVKCEFTLKGATDEKISSKTFKMKIDEQLAENSIVSKDERGVIDDALTFVTEYVPRMELIDVELLENYQTAIQNIEADLVAHKEDYTTQKAEFAQHKLDYTQLNLHDDMIIRELPNGVLSEFKVLANGSFEFVKKVNLAYTIKSTDIKNIYPYPSSVIVDITKPIDYIGYGSTTIPIGSVIINGYTEASSFVNDASHVGKFNMRYTNSSYYIAMPVGTTFNEAKAQLVGVKMMYQLKTPETISLPEGMTPNTMEIIRLSEGLNSFLTTENQVWEV